MLFDYYEWMEVDGLKDFIEEVKDLPEFRSALYNFIKKSKEYLWEEFEVEIKSTDMDQFLEELKENEISLFDFEEQIEWIKEILQDSKSLYMVELDQETDNFIIYEASISNFHPSLFQNVAFFFYETKEDVNQRRKEDLEKPPFTEEQWEKFKHYLETMDIPEDLYEKILEFEEKISSMVEKESQKGE